MSRFALPGVTLGAGFGVAEVNTPFRYPVLATVRVETRWPRCVSLACWRIHSPILGEEWGCDLPPIYRSTAPKTELMFVLMRGDTGRSQPAPAARFIPAGRLQTRLRGG